MMPIDEGSHIGHRPSSFVAFPFGYLSNLPPQRPFQILLSERLLSQTLILVDKQLHLTTTGKNTPFILSFNLMDDGQSQK